MLPFARRRSHRPVRRSDGRRGVPFPLPRPTLLPLVLATLLLAGLAGAQDAPAVDRATAEAEAVAASIEVQTARLDLDAAVRERARIDADPTTLLVPSLLARHDVEAAEDALRNAEATARDGAADAFEAALQARDGVAIARTALDIVVTEAEAARIRLEAGAATESDVARAEDAARSAERDLADAERSFALALDRLALEMGRDEVPSRLREPSDDPPVPSLDEVLARVGENAGLRAALRGVELAEAQLAAVDVAFTSARADVESAQDALATARLRADDLESSLRLALRQTYNAVLAAEARLASVREALATADEDLAVAVVRFEAGSIAQVVLERVRLDHLRRRSDVHAARTALADALRSLDATILGAGR
jgi:outer membrane protein TolC